MLTTIEKQSAKHVFAGLVLSTLSGMAQANEPRITDAERPLARKAICAAKAMPVATTTDFNACVAYIERRNAAKDWKIAEIEPSVNAVCMDRYRTYHISHYQNCQVQLKVAHGWGPPSVPASQAANQEGPSLIGACAKGAAAGVGGALLLQGGATCC
jgi:hypothetical protein